MAGAAPRRQAGNTSQGRIPAPGWLAVNDWQGMRAFDENPWVVDPAERHRGQHQQPHHRRGLPRPPELRLGRRLPHHPRRPAARRPAVSIRCDSFIEIQTDTVSEDARVLLPLIARDLWYSGEPAAAGSAGAAAAGGAGAARQLERRDERAHARAADLRRLAAGAEAAADPVTSSGRWSRWCRAPSRSSSSGSIATSTAPAAWCDVRQTTAVETCTEMARLALDDALLELEERLRAAAGELALGRRPPGAAPAPDPRQRAGAAATW